MGIARHHILIMGGDDHRGANPVQFLEQTKQALAERFIEISGRSNAV